MASPFLIVTAPQFSAHLGTADSSEASSEVTSKGPATPETSRPCGQGLWALLAVRTFPPGSPAQQCPLSSSLGHAESFMENAALTIHLGLHGSHVPALPSPIKPQSHRTPVLPPEGCPSAPSQGMPQCSLPRDGGCHKIMAHVSWCECHTCGEPALPAHPQKLQQTSHRPQTCVCNGHLPVICAYRGRGPNWPF